MKYDIPQNVYISNSRHHEEKRKERWKGKRKGWVRTSHDSGLLQGWPQTEPPLFSPLPIENPAPTRLPVRIAANLMLLIPLAASSGNTISTVSGLWNDMQRWMTSNLMCILLLGKPVPAAKPWPLEVIVEMVGRHNLIRGDFNLFSVQDYPCRYGLCLIAHNIIKLGVCSYMFNFLFAPILSSSFNFSCYYSVYDMSC